MLAGFLVPPWLTTMQYCSVCTMCSTHCVQSHTMCTMLYHVYHMVSYVQYCSVCTILYHLSVAYCFIYVPPCLTTKETLLHPLDDGLMTMMMMIITRILMIVMMIPTFGQRKRHHGPLQPWPSSTIYWKVKWAKQVGEGDGGDSVRQGG